MRIAFLVLACAATATLGRAQGFINNTQDIPQGVPENSFATSNVDFADVDLDGDWDALFSTGDDIGSLQNRIWINMGGAQGGTLGSFEDQTATRFPAVNDTSRDVELADVDADGDLDLHISNTSSFAFQANLWWINMGGAQGGTPGFFEDQTATRWVGLGENNGTTKCSSIPLQQVLPSGGFLDWSGESDFGDLDADGDLDLVHTSYGGSFSGAVPTRLFLNDGDGFFEEFNPSCFQLPGGNIQDGDPGLWCEGLQFDNTQDTTGAECDIATAGVDLDLGDTDGDFDLDFVLGDIQDDPRFFENRLDLGAGLAFRDVTNAVFPPNYATGQGHYEQELGDLDNDADLDLVGLGWQPVFADVTFENDGAGQFGDMTALPGSAADDEEVDFFDFDEDGDLDVYIANFSGTNKLYRNLWSGGDFEFELTSGVLPIDSGISRDADAADVDGDGDPDLFVANTNGPDFYMQNLTTADDVHAPRIANVEQARDRVAGPAPTVVRAQVDDNAPYYVTWYNATELQYTVNGGGVVTVPMRSSGGQIFRGEIPGALTGVIRYTVFSEDEYGNRGFSNLSTYTATGTCDGGIELYCTAKTSSCGTLPAIGFTGTPSASASSGFELSASEVRAQRSGLLLYSNAGPAAIPFQGGLLCVAPVGLRRTIAVFSGGTAGRCDGTWTIDMNAFAAGLLGGNPEPYLRNPGEAVSCQWIGRDTAANGSLLSDALSYLVCP